MAMTEAQIEGVYAALRTRFGEDLALRCPLCQQTAWEIREGYLAIPIQDPERPLRVLGGKAVVFLPLTCLTCAYVVQFDVYSLGLVHLFPHLTQD